MADLLQAFCSLLRLQVRQWIFMNVLCWAKLYPPADVFPVMPSSIVDRFGGGRPAVWWSTKDDNTYKTCKEEGCHFADRWMEVLDAW